MFGGDVMLGRLVKQAIQRNGPNYPLGSITALLKSADLTIMNLECAITDTNKVWHGFQKAFYFGAPSTAIHSLVNAGIDIVSLANNHLLDFDYQGLTDTLNTLDTYHIKHTGAGNNLAEAIAPCSIEVNGIHIGVLAYCDHQSDFAATNAKAGIAYLDLSQQAALLQLEQDFQRLQQEGIELPILSLHWGPNMVYQPSQAFIKFAHHAIDIGYKKHCKTMQRLLITILKWWIYYKTVLTN